MRPVVALLTGVLLAGCATLFPAQREIERAQALADRIAAHAGVRSVRITAAPVRRGAVVTGDGIVIIDPDLLEFPWLVTFAVAHEMAHWIAGDPARRARLRGELAQNQPRLLRALELETDARAVELAQNQLRLRAALRAVELEADSQAIDLLSGAGEMSELEAILLAARVAMAAEIRHGGDVEHPSGCERLDALHRRSPALLAPLLCAQVPATPQP